MMDVLLYAPQYRPNMSSMIRTAEFYGLKTIYIYDKNELLTPPTNKKGRAEMQHMGRVWTAGAIDHIDICIISDAISFVKTHNGRKVGTLISDQAIPINAAIPQDDDLLIMGPEKSGLPREIIDLLDLEVCIPHIGNTDCLNVAVSFGIFLHKWSGDSY